MTPAGLSMLPQQLSNHDRRKHRGLFQCGGPNHESSVRIGSLNEDVPTLADARSKFHSCVSPTRRQSFEIAFIWRVK